MLTKKLIFPALITLPLILANCTKSASDFIPSGGGHPAPAGGDVVRQQGLTGEYTSDCLPYALGGMRTITLSAVQEDVTIETDFYNGSDCRSLDHKEPLKGHLEDDGVTGAVHLVKLNIPLNAHVSTWRYYKMTFSDGLIKTTDAGGDPSDLANVQPTISLKRVGNPTPAPAPMPPPSNGQFGLTSGDYSPVSGNSDACPQNIGIESSGNVIAGLFVTFLPPCGNGTTTLDCQGNVCSSSAARITFLSTSSYRYENLSDNWSAVFQRR